MTWRHTELFKNSIKQYVWVLAERRIDTDSFGYQKIYRKQVTHVNELRN